MNSGLDRHGRRPMLMDWKVISSCYGNGAGRAFFLTAENIRQNAAFDASLFRRSISIIFFRKHNVSEDLDFMSIDVDGQEFWIWMALQHRPKVVISEYNVGQGRDASVTIQFDVNHCWDGTRYHGASLRAMEKLAKSKFYTLVYANIANAFFVRDDLVSNKSDFYIDRFFIESPSHPEDKLNRPWVVI